jgi:hypothetical protein
VGVQHYYAGWAQRPQRSEPYISIKGPAGLGNGAESWIEAVTRDSPPFPVTLTGPSGSGADHLAQDM